MRTKKSALVLRQPALVMRMKWDVAVDMKESASVERMRALASAERILVMVKGVEHTGDWAAGKRMSRAALALLSRESETRSSFPFQLMRERALPLSSLTVLRLPEYRGVAVWAGISGNTWAMV